MADSLTTVAELQEKLAKSDRLKKKAIRIAGMYQERMEYLGKLMDNKSRLVQETIKDKEGLEKKMTDLTKDLEEERRRTSEKNRLLDASETEKEELRMRMREAEQLVDQATSELLMHRGLCVRRDEEGDRNEGDIEDKKSKLVMEMMKEKEELQKKMIELMNELEEERRRTSEKNRLLEESETEKEELRMRMREAEPLVERATSQLLTHRGMCVRRYEEGGRDDGDIEETENEELRRRMREAELLVKRATRTLLMNCGLSVRREEEGGRDDGDIEETQEVTDSIPVLNEPVEVEEERGEMREEGRDEPIENLENAEQLPDLNLDWSDVGGSMAENPIENEERESDAVDHSATISKRSSEIGEMEKRKSSRIVSRPLNNRGNMEESDVEEETLGKKSRSECCGKNGKVLSCKRRSPTKVSSESRTVKSETMNGDEQNSMESDTEKKVSSSHAEKEKRKRPSRKAPSKCPDSMEESDGEEERIVKRRRSESVRSKGKVDHQIRRTPSKGASHSKKVKMNKEESVEDEKEKNELKCLECEYRSTSVAGWIEHLRRRHSTTPYLAGCIIQCDCGHKVYSNNRHECGIANFTIIRNENQPIRRFSDPAVTPKCIICEIHPKTPIGYTGHLRIHHNTTLLKNRIYLLCSCGNRFNSDTDKKTHDKECTGRNFSLHKLDKD